MSLERRDFMRGLALAASLAGLNSTAYAESQAGEQPASLPGFDPDAAAYWTQLLQRPPLTTLGTGQSADGRTPRFFIHTSREAFRFPTSPPVKPEELEKFAHPSVRLRVVAFKPSTDDQKKIDNSQSATLRVDMLQQGMLDPAQSDAKAATSVSGQTAQGTKLNPRSVTGFTVGGEQAVTLPGGGGHLNWAFFVQEKTAAWHAVLSFMIKASGLAATSFAPVMHLGAIAKGAWTGVNSMMGGLMPTPDPKAAKATYWVLTPGLVPVAASQNAFQDPSFADGLPLIKGAHYVIVPQDHYKKFGDAMGKMIVAQGGYVVPQGTKPQDVFVSAQNTPELRDVTYLTVYCESIAEAPSGCDNKTSIKST